MLQNLQNFAINADSIINRLDVVRQNAEHRVILQQMRHRLDVAKIIYCNDLDWCL